jgi:hypothetical protein
MFRRPCGALELTIRQPGGCARRLACRPAIIRHPVGMKTRNLKVPGAINLAAFDHVETVKLEGLWSFYWHKDYVAPAKRPGLK